VNSLTIWGLCIRHSCLEDRKSRRLGLVRRGHQVAITRSTVSSLFDGDTEQSAAFSYRPAGRPLFALPFAPTRTPLGRLSQYAVAMTCPTLSRLAVTRSGVPPELVPAGPDLAGPHALPVLLAAGLDLPRRHMSPKLACAGPDLQTVRSGVGGRATTNRRQRKPPRQPLRRPRERRDGAAGETRPRAQWSFSEPRIKQGDLLPTTRAG
jgi:hypothetical protein